MRRARGARRLRVERAHRRVAHDHTRSGRRRRRQIGHLDDRRVAHDDAGGPEQDPLAHREVGLAARRAGARPASRCAAPGARPSRARRCRWRRRDLRSPPCSDRAAPRAGATPKDRRCAPLLPSSRPIVTSPALRQVEGPDLLAQEDHQLQRFVLGHGGPEYIGVRGKWGRGHRSAHMLLLASRNWCQLHVGRAARHRRAQRPAPTRPSPPRSSIPPARSGAAGFAQSPSSPFTRSATNQRTGLSPVACTSAAEPATIARARDPTRAPPVGRAAADCSPLRARNPLRSPGPSPPPSPSFS